MPTNGQAVKIAHYSRSKFNSLSSKDSSTIYYVEETDGKIKQYIGSVQVVSDSGSYLPITGGTLTGNLNLGNNIVNTNKITQSGSTASIDFSTLDELLINNKFRFDTSTLSMSSSRITHVGSPTTGTDAVNRDWVTSNTRSSSWTPTWTQVSGRPSLAAVATSGSYNDLSNKPSIPAGTVTKVSLGTTHIPGMTMAITNGTTTPTITTSIDNAANFRAAIGAGTSNLTIGTTSSTAKAGNYHPTWSQVSGKPDWIGSSKPNYTAEEIGARESTWVPLWTQVSGRPSLAAVATSGSYNDLSNKPSGFWKQIYPGTSSALSKTSTTSITVPSDVYAGRSIAVEIRYGSSSGNSYTNKIVFVTLGTNTSTGSTKTHPGYVSFSEFDGQYLKNISTKCYVTTTAYTASILFGHLKTLIGSFSGNNIDWTTQASDSISVYIGKIWVLE